MENLIVGESYLVKKASWECYCTFKQTTDKGFVFDNSGVQITILTHELKQCIEF